MKLLILASSALVLSGAALAEEPAGDLSEQLGAYQMAYPFPSADSAKLAFQGNFDGRWQLYAMTLEDGSIERLHTSPQDDTHPAWSPDGKKLAFISNRDGNDEVYLLDAETGAAKSIAPHPGKDGHPKWSADGEWLVFNRTFDPKDTGGGEDAAILKVRSDGSDLTIVSDSDYIETFASFSPDAGSVAFVEWRPDGEDNVAGDIVVVNTRTNERRNLTNSTVFDAYPYWGAGDWIYFTSFLPRGETYEGVVRRVNAVSGEIEDLTPFDGVTERRVIPNREETMLFFNRSDEGRTLLHKMPLTPIEQS